MASKYTRQLNVFSPQRSAALGRATNLPQDFALSYRGTNAPIAPSVQPPPRTIPPVVDDQIPSAPVDTFGGGPGVGAFGGEATPGPSAVDTGLISPETGEAFEKGASLAIFGNTRGEPTLSTLTGIPGLIANPVIKGITRAGKEAVSYLNEELGDPIGTAKDAVLNAIANTLPDLANVVGLGGYGNTQATGMQGGIPAAQAAGHAHGLSEAADANLGLADVPAPSSLADIGIGGPAGGGGYEGGGYGMPGSEGVGGIW